MELSRLLLVCLVVAVRAVLAAAAAAPAAAAADVPVSPKPGCPTMTRCGNIEVPFPFALNRRCAITEQFQLNCTTTAGGTKVLFHDDGHGNKLEVMKINVKENQVRAKNSISRQCYNQSMKTMVLHDEARMNITGMPYVLSSKDNKVTVLGCPSFGYMVGRINVIGCHSTCVDPPKNGSCSYTAGCCQIQLPKNVQTTQLSFNDTFQQDATQTQINQIRSEEYRCNYAAVMEKNAFKFKTIYLTSTAFYDTYNARVPVMMDWAISNKKCNKTAENDKDVPYACVANNSHCVKNDAGYACNCSSGYKGNPYLINGCTELLD